MNKATSVAGYLMMVAGILGLLLTHSLFSKFPLVIIVQAFAVVLMISARITFGRRSYHLAANPTQGGLVTTGPYRYIRHPIYTSVCLFVFAGAFAHPSLRSGLFVALILAAALLRIFCEETLILRQYPEYEEYSKRTWRMLPFVF